MAKFNKPNTIKDEIERHPDKTTNYEDAIAFKLSDKEKLYQQCCTWLVGEPRFYKDVVINAEEGKVEISDTGDKQIINLIRKVAKTDPEFVLKLAYYIRKQLYLRSCPIAMLGEATNINEAKPYIKTYTKHILSRADEPRELLAYYLNRFGEPLPNSLKKGIADSLSNFDEYQTEKYKGGKGRIKYSNVLKMCHPKPKDKTQEALFNYLLYEEGHKKAMKDRLKYLPIINAKQQLLKLQGKPFDDKAKKLAQEAHATWEVLISVFGSRKECWETLQLPYMAKLRNLRNLLDKKVNMTKIIEDIKNPELVAKSKQLPFRFLSAYKSIVGNNNPNTSKVMDAVELAMETSVKNIPRLEGVTFMAADNSGSMTGTTSEKSKIMLLDIANGLMAMAHKFCDSPITSVFGENFGIVNVPQVSGILSNTKAIGDFCEQNNIGHSTNGHKAVQYLIKNKVKVDRIMIFTDQQMWDSEADDVFGADNIATYIKKYKREINPKVYTYVFNLQSYGTCCLPRDEPNVALISGWSDNVFKFIKLFEGNKKQAVDTIEEIKLPIEKKISTDWESEMRTTKSRNKLPKKKATKKKATKGKKKK